MCVYHVNVGQYDKSYSWKFAALCVITLSVPGHAPKKDGFSKAPFHRHPLSFCAITEVHVAKLCYRPWE